MSALCPNMDEAVDRIIEEKYGPDGMFTDAAHARPRL